MNLKKNIVLLAGGGVASLLFIAVLVMLVRFHLSYVAVDRELDANQMRLNALYARDPYPSDANVQVLETNRNALLEYYDALFAGLKAGQVEPAPMEPAEFPLLLERAIRQLHARAAEADVTLPPRFAFGFDRYALGALPEEADVPRLVVQLTTVERLCSLLFESRISEIMSIARSSFEAGAVAAAGEPGGDEFRRRRRVETPVAAAVEAGAGGDTVDPSGLFSRERFMVEFKGKDSAVWSVLNALGRSRSFAVVTRVDFASGSAPFKPAGVAAPQRRDQPAPAPAAAAPAAPAVAAPPRHEERIVAGREPVQARVEVDVYRFLAPVAEKEVQP